MHYRSHQCNRDYVVSRPTSLVFLKEGEEVRLGVTQIADLRSNVV
jgi:hypothetical protein